MHTAIAQKDLERKPREKKNIPIKAVPSNHSRKTFPQGRYLSSVRIAVPNQKLQLMSHQRFLPPDTISWPPPKTAPAQPLLTKPEPLAIIHKELDGRGSFVTKNKKTTREGIRLQDLPAHPRQSVDPPAKVHRLDRHPDPHLGNDLDHSPCLQKARPSSTGSKSLGTPLNDILILAPFEASISTRHSEAVIDGPKSSFTKFKSGLCPIARLLPLARVTRFLKPL
jgi:hypothetical protein